MKVTICEIGLSTEEEVEGEEDGEIKGFGNFTYVIVAVYFAKFIMYRNTRRPCFVSKKAYNCSIWEL